MRPLLFRAGSRLGIGRVCKEEFVSLSHNYQNGDESKLPYPELSPEGRSLHKMTKLLRQYQIGITLSPRFDDPHIYLLRAQNNIVFNTTANELAACISAQVGSNVFEYWRQNGNLDLGLPSEKVAFWINPSFSNIKRYKDNIIAGYIGEAAQEGVIETLGEVGILHALPLPSGFWLTP